MQLLVLGAEGYISLDELEHALITLRKVVLGTLILLLLNHLSRLISRYLYLVACWRLKHLRIVEGVHEH